VPNEASFRRARAHAFHRLGRFSDAIVDYNVAIEIEPEFEPTLAARADAAARRIRRS
jgi:Flp pilus assembly protein TadD